MNTRGILHRNLLTFVIAAGTFAAQAQTLEPEKGTSVEAAQEQRVELLAAYPNPFNDVLHVNIPLSYRRAVRIDLYPTTGGPAVLHHEMSWTSNVILETASIPNGTYMLTIRQLGENGAMLGVARVTCAH